MTFPGPNAGGCWFCYEQDDKLAFSWEFDAFVHLTCIEKERRDHPENPEADVMHFEFRDRSEEEILSEARWMRSVVEKKP